MAHQLPSMWKGSPVEGVPVIPYGTLLTGHLHLLLWEPDFQKSLHLFSVEHADEQGRCTFWMGANAPTLSVTRCEDVQMLLKFSSNREILSVPEMHRAKFFGTDDLTALSGKEWKSKRAAIINALHGKKVMEHNEEAITQAAENLVKSLSALESVDDIMEIMKMVVLDAFGMASLSEDFGSCRKLKPSRIMKDFEYISAEVTRRTTTIHALNPASHVYEVPTYANKKLNFIRNRMDNFILDIIDKRMERMANAAEGDDVIPQDFLTALIEEAIQNGEDSTTTTDQEGMDRMLSDTVKSLLFAGYETSSVTLTYVLYLLSKHPDVEKRCMDEIRAQPDEYVYLDAVIKETLRLLPPITSTTRMLERDVRFGGLHVREGTRLSIPIWIIQRDDRHFKWALKFIPERWARLDDEKGIWVPRSSNDTNDFDGVPIGNSQAFLAFSAGGRSCAGQRLALQKIRIILLTLLQHFKFEIPKGYQLNMHQEGPIQCPDGGIPMNIRLRRQM